MRPLRLQVTAFGPYAGTQEIDFTDLGQSQLFLIHGPTGGGKSTVLDALCYALYGETADQDRTGDTMRSHYAAPELATEIVLDFQVGRGCFRISRSPTQELAKKRGEGMTTRQAAVELVSLDSETGDVSEVLETRNRDTRKRIVELLGFELEQFRQVIVLPQGRFREFLVADSAARERILSQIFETQIYKDIEGELREQATMLRRDVEQKTQRVEGLLESQDCDAAETLGEKLEKARADHEVLGRRLPRLKTAEAKARAAHTSGKELSGRIEVAASRSRELRLLEVQADSVNQLRVQAERAARAASVRAERNAAITATRGLIAAREKLELAIQSGKVAADAHRKSKANVAALDATRRDLDEKRRERDRLDQLDERVMALTEARRAVANAEATFKRDEKQHTAAVEAVQRITASRNEIESGLEGLRQSSSALGTTQAALEKAIRQRTARQNLAAKDAELSSLHQELSSANHALELRRTELVAAEEQVRVLQAARQAAQAGLLAQTLEDGQPCPVCGGADHPQPASVSESVPDEVVIDDAERHASGAKVAMESARETSGDLQAKLAAAGASRNSIIESLGDAASESIESCGAAVEKFELEQQKQLSDQMALVAAEENILTLSEQLEIAHVSELEARQLSADAKIANSAAVATLEERLASVPEAFRAGNALATRKAELDREVDALNMSIDAAEQAAAAAERLADKASAEVSARETTLKEAVGEEEVEKANWFVARDKAGFDSDEAYDAAATDATALEKLQNKIRAFDEDLRVAKDRLEQASRGLENQSPPEIEALARAESEAAAARESIERELSALDSQIKSIEKTNQRITQIQASMADKEAQYGIVAQLAQVASGKNPKQLSFQRFVLAALLDDVLAAATLRLKRISKGRYQLLRADESADGRTAGGLDLLVEDDYTGLTRSVKTLSGGESFMAALSLALGLADVVQSYAGGIRMDTIFIDEGFGSLDSEALDLAMNALIDLQNSGRLVGIISHVSELRERIDVRLEVTAGRDGSRAEFVGV